MSHVSSKLREWALLLAGIGLYCEFALAGLLAGLLAAVALARVASAVLAGVSPVDLPVYAAAAAFTINVTLAAAAIPAWHALRVDPVVALRAQ